MELNDEVLQTVVAKSIMETITPETSEKLITNAIKALLNKEKVYGYDDKISPLMRIFNDQVASVTGDLIRERLTKDADFTAKVKKLIDDSISKTLEDPEIYEEMVEKMSRSLRFNLFN